jgi:hypothetical protein
MDYKLELVLISVADFTDPDGNVWLLQEVDRGQG